MLSAAEDGAARTDGELLRGVTREDQMVLERLERYRHDAYEACTARLAQSGSPPC